MTLVCNSVTLGLNQQWTCENFTWKMMTKPRYDIDTYDTKCNDFVVFYLVGIILQA